MTNDEIYHFGIKGMKWGVRRYQNKDGSLTAEGKKRQERADRKAEKKEQKRVKRQARLDEQTKRSAIYVLDNEKRNLNFQANRTQKQAQKLTKKADKQVSKSLKYIDKASKLYERHDSKRAEKQMDKWDKSDSKALSLMNRANIKQGQAYVDRQKAKLFDKKINEIESGYLKPGEDYVTKTIVAAGGGMYYSQTTLEFISDKGKRFK